MYCFTGGIKVWVSDHLVLPHFTDKDPDKPESAGNARQENVKQQAATSVVIVVTHYNLP